MLIEYITTNGLQNPFFREVDPSNQVVWSLDYASLVPPPSGSSGDWCHANSVTVDIAKNVVYANCRWAGLLKTTYQNPTRQWLLQGSYIKTRIGDITFSPSSSAFSDTHDPEIHDDGTICSSTTEATAAAPPAAARPCSIRGPSSTRSTRPPRPPRWSGNSRATPRSPTPGTRTTGTPRSGATWIGCRTATTWSRPASATPPSRAASSRSRRTALWSGSSASPPDYGVYRADRITPPLVHAIN